MPVSILKQRDYLIASIQSDLTDSEVVALRDSLLAEVALHRSRGVIVDVAALDVIDSFVSRSLSTVALTNRLRGAKTVVVGIRPEVAVAMSQFGLGLDAVETALDLEAGLELLDG
ncbi:MAG: STAS domain-containing protein [Actinomycetota bacterium]|nr:STAS domain-containing protein [Chloroflexota bacterium]MDQ3647348.1 STAS domain-containing protein [Actinomycetota bacterium]